MNHVRLKTVKLKNNPAYDERWLQGIIAEDPSIIGIGDIVLRDRERFTPGGGRLDLLFQDAEGYGRYEVEIQLGCTDEAHIIRTIEYWDLERRRYPQYDHTAVIIAEDITSRFLNVISLFNGLIPIMAFQITAIETTDGIGLHFTKVLDTLRLGYVAEDEETNELTDRNYWETKRGTHSTVVMADQILDIVKEFQPDCDQTYNKYYIGFKINNRSCNFAICRAQKSGMRLEISIPQDETIDNQLEESGIDILDYDKRGGKYKLKLKEEDIVNNRTMLKDLLYQAYLKRV